MPGPLTCKFGHFPSSSDCSASSDDRLPWDANLIMHEKTNFCPACPLQPLPGLWCPWSPGLGWFSVMLSSVSVYSLFSSGSPTASSGFACNARIRHSPLDGAPGLLGYWFSRFSLLRFGFLGLSSSVGVGVVLILPSLLPRDSAQAIAFAPCQYACRLPDVLWLMQVADSLRKVPFSCPTIHLSCLGLSKCNSWVAH